MLFQRYKNSYYCFYITEDMKPKTFFLKHPVAKTQDQLSVFTTIYRLQNSTPTTDRPTHIHIHFDGTFDFGPVINVRVD